MVVELIFAKSEVGGPLSVGDVLVVVGVALTYLSIIVFVVTSERRALRVNRRRRRARPHERLTCG